MHQEQIGRALDTASGDHLRGLRPFLIVRVYLSVQAIAYSTQFQKEEHVDA